MAGSPCGQIGDGREPLRANRRCPYLLSTELGRGGRPRPPANEQPRVSTRLKCHSRFGRAGRPRPADREPLRANRRCLYLEYIIIKPYGTALSYCHCEERSDVAIALARRGGTKCRKNSPQVTVFSQSGEATMLRAGREYGRSGTVRLKRLPLGDLRRRR